MNKKIIKLFDVDIGEQLTKLFCKSDVFLLADIFEKFIKVSFEKFDIDSFILHSSTWLYMADWNEIY